MQPWEPCPQDRYLVLQKVLPPTALPTTPQVGGNGATVASKDCSIRSTVCSDVLRKCSWSHTRLQAELVESERRSAQHQLVTRMFGMRCTGTFLQPHHMHLHQVGMPTSATCSVCLQHRLISITYRGCLPCLAKQFQLQTPVMTAVITACLWPDATCMYVACRQGAPQECDHVQDHQAHARPSTCGVQAAGHEP
jgi:hypothetical protein